MLELLVAASKMVDKLAVSEMKPMIFQKEEEFLAVKDRINAVMKKGSSMNYPLGLCFQSLLSFSKNLVKSAMVFCKA